MRRNPRKSTAVWVLVCMGVMGGMAGLIVGTAIGTSAVTSAGTLAVVAGQGQSGLPTPGPAESSALGEPNDVAADAAGDLYISDPYSLVIERVTSAGQLSVIAGDGQAGAPTPGPATSSDLWNPFAVAVDHQGNVYIADSLNDVVEKVTPGGTLSIIAGKAGQAGAPTPGPATSSDVSPYGLAVDSDGNVYIADDYDTASTTKTYILKVTESGTLSIVAGNGLIGSPTAGPATSSEFDFPDGLAVDGSDDLYISDAYANVIAKVTPSGELSIVAGNGTMGTPVPGPATSSPLDNPAGIAVAGGGELYIADPLTDDVLAVSPSGTLSVLAGTGVVGPPTAGPASDSDLANPLGVAVDGSENVYIADLGNADIEEVLSGLGGGVGTKTGTTTETTPGSAATTPTSTTPTAASNTSTTPQVSTPKTISPSAVFGLPSTKQCVSKRKFTIHVRDLPGITWSSAVIKINHKRVKSLGRAHITARVNLTGLPKGTFVLSITAKATNGRTATETRTYHTCVQGHKHH